jgi:rod shape-determining protein MreD
VKPVIKLEKGDELQFLKAFAWLLLALVLQQTLIRLAAMHGARPDLILLALVAISLRYGSLYGLYCGLLIGLIQDVYAIDNLGANALAKSLTGYLIGLLDERMVKIMPATKVLLLGGGFVIHDLIYLRTVGLSGTAYAQALFKVSLPSLIYTLIVAALVYSLAPNRSPMSRT